jgi:hypothetical protein
MTRIEAREYLRGLDPEAIGVAPIAAKTRKIRFDRHRIDAVLDRLSSIMLDNKSVADQAGDASQLDELLR